MWLWKICFQCLEKNKMQTSKLWDYSDINEHLQIYDTMKSSNKSCSKLANTQLNLVRNCEIQWNFQVIFRLSYVAKYCSGNSMICVKQPKIIGETESSLLCIQIAALDCNRVCISVYEFFTIIRNLPYLSNISLLECIFNKFV